MLGVTQQAVGKWETGAFHPRSADRGSPSRDPRHPGRCPAGAAQGAGCVLRCGPQCVQPLYRVSGPGCGHGARRVRCAGLWGGLRQGIRLRQDPENYFFLVVKGDSMEPRISDGDLALVHRQSTLDNGDLGVLVYGSDGEGTLKKYIQRGNSVVLHPLTRPMRKWSSRGRSWITCIFTSQARSWRPRPSGDFSPYLYCSIA